MRAESLAARRSVLGTMQCRSASSASSVIARGLGTQDAGLTADLLDAPVGEAGDAAPAGRTATLRVWTIP
jgi:hypothetical protein